VPAVHAVAVRLPAVSGSSGRLVIYGPRQGVAEGERTWPGQVFDDPEAAYERAMREFVGRSAPRTPLRRASRTARPQRPESAEQVARRARREQQRRLAAHRGPLLQQRQQEDAAWQAVCRERHARLRPDHWTPTFWAAHLVAEDHYQLLRAQRQATLARRQQEDAQWQADQAQLAAPPAPPAAKPPWIAILVVTDNCTRQCLGLPLFAAGPKVTAEVVVAALRALLPDELQFLISDRGTHFTANPFAQFAQEEDFVHVLIARHRPESNGIAERFVRTLKEWLAERAWSGVEALALCLEQCCAAYNDRPHQGLALPGLSPNEFAARFWLL
jgi:transposase InsO family protein